MDADQIGKRTRPDRARDGLLLLALFVVGVLIRLHEGPETIPDPRREVLPEQNVFLGLAAAREFYVDPPAGMRYEGPADVVGRPDIAAFVGRNGEAIRRTEEALRRPEFRTPSQDAGLPALRLSEVWILRAHLRAGGGDTAGALHDLFGVIELGGRSAAGAESTHVYHGGLSIERRGLYAMTAILSPPLDGSDLSRRDPSEKWPTAGWSGEERELWRGALDELLHWNEEPAAVKRALAGEHHETHLDSDWLRDYGVLPSRPCLYWPQRMRQIWRAECEQALSQADLPRWERPPWRRTHNLSLDVVANLDAIELLAYLPDYCRPELDLADARRARIAATASRIALKLYHEKQGRLPADWSELVDAGYLPEPPVDPFTGEPLVYRPSEGLVYSAGRNGKVDRLARCYL